MKVTIGDLDYYYTKNKKDLFNPDVMKISSYHKQLGDQVNFVLTEDDINRPYDLCYIIKEKNKTKNPPMRFFTDRRVRWWGNAYRMRLNGKMSDVMMACRPDYLIYPNRDTKLERADQVRFFNQYGEKLAKLQDWHNAFTNKKVLVTDTAFGVAPVEDTVAALNALKGNKGIEFMHPIWLQKIVHEPRIREAFLELHFSPGSTFKWKQVEVDNCEPILELLAELKEKNPSVNFGSLPLHLKIEGHGENPQKARNDFNKLKKIIIFTKKNGVSIQFNSFYRAKTPYFFLFEEVIKWSEYHYKVSGLEHLTQRYNHCNAEYQMREVWNNPMHGDPVFRDALRQTYQDHEFLLTQGKDSRISENDIPGALGDKEFAIGL